MDSVANEANDESSSRPRSTRVLHVTKMSILGDGSGGKKRAQEVIAGHVIPGPSLAMIENSGTRRDLRTALSNQGRGRHMEENVLGHRKRTTVCRTERTAGERT